MAEPRHWLDSLLQTLSPSQTFSPELGSLLTTDPEAAAMHLAAKGVPPPPVTGQEQAYPPPFANGMNGPNIMGGDGRRPPVTGQEQSSPAPFGRLREQFAGLGDLLPSASSSARAGQMEAAGYPPQAAANTYRGAQPASAPIAQTGAPGGEAAFPMFNPLERPNMAQWAPPTNGIGRAPQAAPQAPRAMAAPMDIRSEVQRQQDAASSPANKVAGLAKALSGLKAPANPETQKISSPRLPDRTAIPSGSPIAALLAKAVAGDPQAMLTLRSAIGGGR